MLSPENISLLSRGLTFAPIIQPNSVLLFKDFNTCIRNLNLKRFFNIKSKKDSPLDIDITLPATDSHTFILENIQKSLITIYDSCQEFGETDFDLDIDLFTQHLQTLPPIVHTHLQPKSKGPYLEAFYRAVFSEFQKQCHQSNNTSKYLYHNLHPGEMVDLKQFTNNPNLVIKPADKRGGIVLQYKIDYVTEGMR